ncbi:ABC transporter permease [Prevotella sp. 10(H)]|uniref:ABC transporter permease n=1 Tax=Prevotella sp. 10(H) TaxID=1158294 RepID=UPI0004A77004|nr:ABC transporter permease [Prevotella sp. 10(H)]
MYKVYLKQAIEILKLNKFISLITIIGTALAIMMIMVLVVTESINHISIAPEINRDKTLYIKNCVKNGKNTDWMMSDKIPYELYKNYLSDLESPEYISAINVSKTEFMVSSDQSEEQILTKVKQTDAAFWRIMAFNFIVGKPFTEEDFNSGIQNAVITESMGKKLFGNNEALGQTIEIDFKPYKVTGIIKDVSQAFKFAYGEAFIPYTSKKGYNNQNYAVLFLIKDKNDIYKAEEEVRAAERKFNAADPEWNLTLFGPYNHRLQILNRWSNLAPNVGEANRKMIFILSILLLIPAVNLSSFSLSRVNRRTEEIGIRKAFGAKKYIILIQILYENFITSLIGGIIGLVLSYITVTALKGWLLDIGADSSIPVSALVSIPVFIGVFLACFLLNLLSAGLPAYWACKKSIVDSINKKNM